MCIRDRIGNKVDLQEKLTKAPCNERRLKYILIRNKVDLQEKRETNITEGEVMRQAIKAVAYYETSAATGTEVIAAFEHLARTILRQKS